MSTQRCAFGMSGWKPVPPAPLNAGANTLGCRIEIEDSEAVGISSIISNLITVFPRNVLTAIPRELFSSFVNCLTHLTCSFGRSAALEEVVSGSSYHMASISPSISQWGLLCF